MGPEDSKGATDSSFRARSAVCTDSSEATRERTGAFWHEAGRNPSRSSRRNESMLVIRCGAVRPAPA